jgi:protein-arginine kinase activator protein McsA
MEEKKDGKTKRTKRALQSDVLGRKGGMGESAADSRSARSVSISSHERCSTCEDWVKQFIADGNPSFAKVLERLLDIEREHLEYVEAHQGRLKARLQESIESKNRFLEKTSALVADIQNLIKEQES